MAINDLLAILKVRKVSKYAKFDFLIKKAMAINDLFEIVNVNE
jgi:hypothetical protein